jgi:hypothetical protein
MRRLPLPFRSRAVRAGGISTLVSLAALLLAGTTWGASGPWERAWGANVGGLGINICTAASQCFSGTTGELVHGAGGGFKIPEGAATDAAGNVYVADTFQHRVQKFDSSGNFLSTWGKDVVVGGGTGFEVCIAAASCQAGQPGGLGGELNIPTDIATDAVGNVYVIDSSNRRIQKFDASGNFQLTWGKNVNIFGGTGFETCNAAAICRAGQDGALGGELSNSKGIATDAAGNVYVADSANNRIQKFDSSGGFLRAWGKDVVGGNAETGFEICTAAASCKKGAGGVLGGELSTPSGVATDGAGNVYVAERTNRIQKFDSSGNWSRTWGGGVVDGAPAFQICTNGPKCQGGTAGGTGGELNSPNGVATDAAGSVYVADTFNDRIQKFDSSGNFLRTWGKDVITGNADTGFEICTVAASCQSGVLGTLGGEMARPWGIATNAAGDLYSVDNLANRVQKFSDFEQTKPAVTINQAAGQADPTSASPISYKVSFSEPVTGFTGADLSFAGSTVSGTLTAVVSGGGANYTVSVAAMSGTGNVIASIPAAKAADLAGNTNTASTSTDNKVSFTLQDPGTSTGGSTGTTGSTGTGLQVTEDPQCQLLRKKLKKAKKAHQAAKVRKLRRKLRALGC